MDRKQCSGCRYWRRLSPCLYQLACHYNLDRYEPRQRDGDRCLSKDTRSYKPKRPEWPFIDQN